MLKKLIILFALVFNKGFSQEIIQIPDWVKEETIKDIPEVSLKKIDNGYYYVLVDEQFNTVQGINFFHYATKAVSETGTESVSQIEISFDPSYQKVNLHYIKIHRGTEVLDRTNESEFKELHEESQRDNGILNGNRTLYANLSDIRKGDVVEYAYSIKGYNKIYNDHLSFEFSFAYISPIGRIARTLIVDLKRELSIKNKNCNIQPVVSSSKNRIYKWLVNNPEPIMLEDNAPLWYDPFAAVLVTDFKSWATVKNWAKSIFQIKTYDASGIKKIVDSVKANRINIEDQITSFVDFVQKQLRYSGNTSGIYTHNPHSPDYVLKNMFGDCKDKSLFLHELLKQINVKSFMVLLNTKKKKTIKEEHPSMNVFDHCILAIRFEGNLFFIDPTYTYQCGSFRERKIPDYRTVFLLDSSDTFFTDLVPDTLSKTFITENFNVINEEGDADLFVETKYTGLNADDIRYYFHNNSIVDIQENYRSFYLKFSDEIEVLDTVNFSDSEMGNELRVTEHYKLKGFWSKSDSTSKKIEKSFLPYVLSSSIRYVDDKIRKQPLDIPFPANIEQKIRVTLPKGWSIEDEIIKEENDFFYFTYTTSIEENTLNLSYVYRAKSDCVPPESYAYYKSKVDFVDTHISLNVSGSSNVDDVFGFNWLLLVTSFASIIISLFICLSLYKKPFTTNFEKRYDQLGGWLILIGIGILITPISLSIDIFKLYRDEFDINYYFFLQKVG